MEFITNNEEDHIKIHHLLFGDSWDSDTMMGKFMAEHILVEAGDIEVFQKLRFEALEHNFISELLSFLVLNQASLRNS
jgi:hypothetical protein